MLVQRKESGQKSALPSQLLFEEKTNNISVYYACIFPVNSAFLIFAFISFR